MDPVSVYQPIVDLESGETVAYEALARGPQGESPAAMFAAARENGTLAELDWACRRAAARGALDVGLGRETALFINVEPAVAGAAPPAALRDEIAHARRELSLVLEITERAITDRPAELLELVAALRADGVRIALDDVGADPRSLALLPVLRPDVIKLDMSMVQGASRQDASLVMNAVWAHHEATGAVILAEGIETEEHLLVARTLGATLGQGWHFGRPGPIPACSEVRGAVGSLATPRPLAEGTPFEIVSARKPTRAGRKDLLLGVSLQLEQYARGLGAEGVIVSAFQDARFFTPATCRRYAALAGGAALVAALGVGLPEEPAPCVRGTALDTGDPVAGEWDVAVLGPHFAAALVARDLGDRGEDRMRRFDFALTFERELVVDAAQSLLGRVSARRAALIA